MLQYTTERRTDTADRQEDDSTVPTADLAA